jgi:hypothetical protein
MGIAGANARATTHMQLDDREIVVAIQRQHPGFASLKRLSVLPLS